MICDESLGAEDGKHNPEGERFLAEKIANFGVLGKNKLATFGMGFFFFAPSELIVELLD